MITTCPNCGYVLQVKHHTLMFECPQCQKDYQSYWYFQKQLEQRAKQSPVLEENKQVTQAFLIPDYEALIYITLVFIFVVTLFLGVSAEII